jgi:hypothetical protein
MSKSILRAITVALIISGCAEPRKDNVQFKSADIWGVSKFPEPKFDADINLILKEYTEHFEADRVLISRPFTYTSSGDSSYWLRVEFLNPTLDKKTFKEFGNEVAQNTLNHLTNDQDFEKIEIGVTQKKGFIITFSSSQNGFFYRDSLQVAQ